MFSLGYELRMKIIDLDIRKKARLYRRSRAGKRLQHRIQTLLMKLRLHRPRNRSLVQGTNVTIPSTVNRVCKKTIDYRCATVNCCSIVNKTSDIKVELMEHNLDICALTETWIREGDNTTAIQLCMDGYSSVSIPREGRIGGGIAIVHRSDITLRSKSVYNYQTMECADILLDFQNMLVYLCVIYRPPDTSIASFLWWSDGLPGKKCNFPGQDDHSWWCKHPYQQGVASRFCSLSGDFGWSWLERPCQFCNPSPW